tara:strand:- start:208 stop:462 length:255 start_codon:yes stop_codon:yes gene_type:complete
MAKVNEVYRLPSDDKNWVDVSITSVTGQDTVDYIITETIVNEVNIAEGESGSTVGTTVSAVDLTTVTNTRLYDENGVTDTEEAA